MDSTEALSPAQQRWFDHLKRAEQESLSILAYSVREGLSASSLYGFRMWLKRRARVGAIAPPLPTFATVKMTCSSADANTACVLEFSSGLRLRLEQLPDPSWLTAVLGQVSAMGRGARSL